MWLILSSIFFIVCIKHKSILLALYRLKLIYAVALDKLDLFEASSLLWAYHEANEIPVLPEAFSHLFDIREIWQPLIDSGRLRMWTTPMDLSLGNFITSRYKLQGLTHLQCFEMSVKFSHRQKKMGICFVEPFFLMAAIQALLNQNRFDALVHILLEDSTN